MGGIFIPVGVQQRLYGGNNRARTCDPLLVRQVLFQLSYAPIGASSNGSIPANYVVSIGFDPSDLHGWYVYQHFSSPLRLSRNISVPREWGLSIGGLPTARCSKYSSFQWRCGICSLIALADAAHNQGFSVNVLATCASHSLPYTLCKGVLRGLWSNLIFLCPQGATYLLGFLQKCSTPNRWLDSNQRPLPNTGQCSILLSYNGIFIERMFCYMQS